MGQRLYPGDKCPECGERLIRRGRSIWTLFLRPRHLRCPGCHLTVWKRKASAPRRSPSLASGISKAYRDTDACGCGAGALLCACNTSKIQGLTQHGSVTTFVHDKFGNLALWSGPHWRLAQH